MRPKLPSQTSQSENFENASELNSKQIHFWTHKSWWCANNFWKNCKMKTSKMPLKFTANSFVFGRINRENAPRNFSINLIRQKLPKCVWTQEQTGSFFDAKIEKMRPYPFYEACTEKTSKMRLNFTANCFVFRRINRVNVHRTVFIYLARWNLP